MMYELTGKMKTGTNLREIFETQIQLNIKVVTK